MEKVAQSRAQPIYVLIDPSTETEIARWNGAPTVFESKDFREFIELGLPGR